MDKGTFNLKQGLSVQELEERHELSILAPGELAEQDRCNDRCKDNTVDADLSAIG